MRLAGGDEPGSVGRGDIPGSVLVVTNRHVVVDEDRRLRGAPAPLRATFSDGVAAEALTLTRTATLTLALALTLTLSLALTLT